MSQGGDSAARCATTGDLVSMVISPAVDAEGRIHSLVVTFQNAPGFELRLTGVAAAELRDFLVALPGMPPPGARRDAPVRPRRPPPTSIPGPGESRGYAETWADHLFHVLILGVAVGGLAAVALAIAVAVLQ